MNQTWKIIVAVFITAIVVGGGVYYWQTQNSTGETVISKNCIDEPGGTPVITSLSVSSAPAETNFEIKGCNFASLDGVFNPWIENSQGVKGRLVVVGGGTAKLLNVKLQSPLCKGEWVKEGGSGCDRSFILTPGEYKVGVTYVGDKVGETYLTKKSNEMSFTITQTQTSATQKSFVEYFVTRDRFLNSGMNKDPEQLGLKELAEVAVTCPDRAGTPCGGSLVILSKDALHLGNQEFYLAFTMLPGAYTYYGPFTDDLQRIVNESKAIKSLEKIIQQ